MVFKKEWLRYAALAGAGFLLALIFILPHQRRDKGAGRYQLFEVQSPSENTFLLDTKTGRVWEYAPDILESAETGGEGTVIGYYFHENAVEGLHPTGEHLGITQENARRAAARRKRENQER